MISKVIIDTPQDYKPKERKYSDHNSFIIDINAKTKHLEIVGKSVWKLNEKTDWKNYKELLQNKIKLMTGTQKIAQDTLKNSNYSVKVKSKITHVNTTSYYTQNTRHQHTINNGPTT